MSEKSLKLRRRIIKSFAPILVSLAIKLLHKTIKWKIVGEEHLKNIKSPVIFSFFHGRMAMLAFLYRKIRGKDSNIRMILSPHFDGEVGAKIAEKFGIGSISGSSSKKSLQLLKKISKLDNCDIGITPDGPRGPNEKVKSGVIYIAKQKKYPIIPVVYSVKKNKMLNSWDRFMVPLPFTKGVYVIGEALEVPEDAEKNELERYAMILENRMKDIKATADEIVKEM